MRESKGPQSAQLRDEIKSLDRSGEDNMYQRFPRARKTVQERNRDLEQHMSEDLASLPNVSIQKYSKKVQKRGL